MEKQTYFMEQLFDRKLIDKFLRRYELDRHIDSSHLIKRIMQRTQKWNKSNKLDHSEGFSLFVGNRNEHEIYVSVDISLRGNLLVTLMPCLYGRCISKYDWEESWNFEIYYEELEDKRL